MVVMLEVLIGQQNFFVPSKVGQRNTEGLWEDCTCFSGVRFSLKTSTVEQTLISPTSLSSAAWQYEVISEIRVWIPKLQRNASEFLLWSSFFFPHEPSACPSAPKTIFIQQKQISCFTVSLTATLQAIFCNPSFMWRFLKRAWRFDSKMLVNMRWSVPYGFHLLSTLSFLTAPSSVCVFRSTSR